MYVHPSHNAWGPPLSNVRESLNFFLPSYLIISGIDRQWQFLAVELRMKKRLSILFANNVSSERSNNYFLHKARSNGVSNAQSSSATPMCHSANIWHVWKLRRINHWLSQFYDDCDERRRLSPRQTRLFPCQRNVLDVYVHAGTPREWHAWANRIYRLIITLTLAARKTNTGRETCK